MTAPNSTLDTFQARCKTLRFLFNNIIGDGGLSPESPLALLLDAMMRDAGPVDAEVARLRTDAELLDWCHSNVCAITTRDGAGEETEHVCLNHRDDESFREFIDATRGSIERGRELVESND